MKKLLLFLVALYSIHGQAQIKVGEAVPDLRFNTVLNAPIKASSLNDLKGKVILIDFWATWCGSCITAMPHLNQLQQKYTRKLQVIAVTDETVKRTQQFLAVRPSKLWFAVDTGRTLNAFFPHRLIPHSVLIAPDGRLIANTSPEDITDAVIDSVLRGQEVHLSTKKDLQYTSVEELIKTTFPAADTVKQRFVMEGEMPGAPGLSTTYLTDSLWSGRRLTALNCDLLTLYRIAYGNVPYERSVDKTAKESKPTKYRLDIIVQNKADLLPALQRELKKRFDIQATMNPEMKEVQVLKIADEAKFKKIPANTSGKRTYSAGHGYIDQQGITMADLADYLESYGTGKLVADATGINKKYDIKFSYQPENPQSLTKVLTDMGLKLEKEQRKIDMLVFYKP